jgi:cell division septation protein DedD
MKGHKMNATYRLAKEISPAIGDSYMQQFGPLFTLAKAESYAADMRKAGFSVLVVNVAAI